MSTRETVGRERFEKVVSAHLGLALGADSSSQLQLVLSRRLKHLGLQVDEYLLQLESDTMRGELQCLVPLLTVGETFFFRHMQQLLAFRDAVVKSLQLRPERRIRVLCAGCASGEEPYSLAILLEEANIGRDRVEIVAGDANIEALARARGGTYSEWSLREADEGKRRRWFTPQGRNFVLKKAMRERVRFAELNLCAPNDPTLTGPPFDVIFCRNVLMYFTKEQYGAVVRRLYGALVVDGLLFLGHAETLRGVESEFVLMQADRAFFYRRELLSDGVQGSLPAMSSRSNSMSSTQWLEAIDESSRRISQLSEEGERRSVARIRTSPGFAASQYAAPDLDLKEAMGLLAEERFDQALACLRDLPSPSARRAEVVLLEAALLVHSGEFASAAQVCERLLEFAPMEGNAHYLLALCCEARCDWVEAISHNETAVALEPTFSLPRFHLGRLYRRAGQYVRARTELRHACQLLTQESPERLVLFSAGLSKASLLAFFRGELRQAERECE